MPTKNTKRYGVPGLSGSDDFVQDFANSSGPNRPVGRQPLFGSGSGDPGGGSIGGNYGSCGNGGAPTGLPSGPMNAAPDTCMSKLQLNPCCPSGPDLSGANRPDAPVCTSCGCSASAGGGNSGSMGGSGSGSSPSAMPNGGASPISMPTPMLGGGFGGSASLSGFQSVGGQGPFSSHVRMATGNIHHQVSLASVSSIGRGFDFRLSYAAQDSYEGPVAHLWRHNFESNLEIGSMTVSYISGGGQVFDFNSDGMGNWILDTDTSLFATFELTNPSGTVWELKETPSGSVWTFDGSNDGRLTKITDRKGNETTLAYSSGLLTAITEETGRTMTLSYNGSGLLSGFTDPKGNSTALYYDGSGNLTDIIGPEGCIINLDYTDTAHSVTPSDHLITSMTNARGNTTHYEYDSENRISKIVDPEGRELLYAYSTSVENVGDNDGDSFDTTKITMSDGGIYEFRFDMAGNLWRIIFPSGVTNRYFWDAHQHLLYASEGFQLLSGSPQRHGPADNMLNRSNRRTVNARGDATAHLDPTGIVHTFTYDSEGRLTSIHPAQAHHGIEGDWPSHFGSDGFILCAFNDDGSDVYEAPSYLSSTLSTAITNGDGMGGGDPYTAANLNDRKIFDPRVPIRGKDSLMRGVGHWKQTGSSGNGTTFEFSINLTASQSFNLSLYTNSADIEPADVNPLKYYEQFGRDLEFTVQDLEGTHTYRVYNNAPGVWVTFPVRGDSSNPIVVTVTATGEGIEPVLNAVAFDPYYDRRTFYEYTDGYLTKLTNALGEETVYSYNANGTLDYTTDARTHSTHFHYLDSHKNLTKVVDELDGETLFTYDANGNVTLVTDPNLNKRAMTYDGKNRLVSVTDDLGYTMTYDYDGNGNMIASTDAKNRTTFYTFTPSDRLESVTNPLGEKVEMEYNTRGLLSKVTDPRLSTLYFYDTDGSLIRVETPDGESTTLSYDTLHQMVAVTGPNGNQADTAQMLLGGAGNLFLNPGAEKPNPHRNGGYVHGWKRNGSNVARDSSESYEGSYSFPFTQVGQTWAQSEVEVPIGSKMLASAMFKPTVIDTNVTTTLRLAAEFRDFSGTTDTETVDTDLPGSTNTWTQSEELLFDIPGRAQTAPSHPALASFSAQLVELGGATTANAWLDDFKLYSLSTSYKRDRAGRLKSVRTPDGAQSSSEYDRYGRLLFSLDPESRRTNYFYDTLDRVVTVESPTGETTHFVYDEVGNLVSFTDAKTQQTTFTYDELNRLTRIAYPDTTHEDFGYDAGSRLTSYTDNLTRVRTFGYDVADRLTSVTYASDSTTIVIAPDEVGNTTSYTDRNGDVITYVYDDADRLISESRVAASGNATPDWAISSSYNVVGQRIRVREGQGTPVVHWQSGLVYGVNHYNEPGLNGYDDMGRLKGIVGPDDLSVMYQYDHESRLKQAVYGNDVTTTADYDILGRLTGLDISDGTSTLLNLAYQYDLRSNRVAQVTGNTSFDYKIDQEGRLVGEAVNRFVTALPADFEQGRHSLTTSTNDGLQLLSLSDDFVADSINTDRWSLFYTTSNTTDIVDSLLGVEVRQDNGLRIAYPRGYSSRIIHRDNTQPVKDDFGLLNHQVYATLLHRQSFSGDFDIVLDYKESQMYKMRDPDHPTEIYIGDSYFALGMATDPLNLGSGWQIVVEMNQDPVSSFHGPRVNRGGPHYAGTPSEEGKLRIKRVDSTVTAYIWDSGSWFTDGSNWTFTRTGELHLFLTNNTAGGECSSVNFQGLTVSIGYSNIGEFESAVYDAGRTVTWDQLSWTEDLPSGCDVEFQIATSASEDGPWSYVGPDGTSGTKFSTAAGQSVGTSVTGRYLRTKAFLTGSGSATPTVSAIHVSYSGDVTSQYASFTYDDAGNMTTRTLLTDSSFLEETKTYNSLNEIATSSIDDGSTVVNYTYGHDSNGNLTSKTDGTNTWTYTWDDENRLTAVVENSTTIASYEYDSGSRLLKRVAGGTTTNYTWDGWDLIKEEKTGAVTETTRYAVPQGGVQSFVRNGNRYYLHGDGLSSSQLVTDSNGNVAARIIYDAWGNELYASDSVSNGLDARFVGGLGVRNDAATGLIYMRHRWYDASLGRFLSRDPIGFAGGLNLYNYAGVNPVSAADPEGLKTSWDPALTKYERTRIEVFKAEMLKTRKGRILQFFLDDSLEYNFVLTSERLAKSKRTSKEHPGVTLIHTDHFEKDCNGKPRLKPGTYQIVFDIANSPKPGGWMPKTHSPDWAVYPHELGHVYQAMSDPEGYLDGRDGIYRFYSSKRNAILDAVIPRREAYTIRVWEFPILIQAGATYVPSSL